jgi:hypothetical protein
MTGIVENAKGIVSIVRDGLITLILILLIAVPAAVNKSLIRAGFVKGNIAGFEWQAAVEDNNQKLTEAATTIVSLQDQLGKTQTALNESEQARKTLAAQVIQTAPGTVAAETAAATPEPATKQIVQQNDRVLKNSAVRGSALRLQIEENQRLLATAVRPPGQ